MKAALKADGYIQIESENEEERQVLNVIADEGIALAHISWGGSTKVTMRRSYYPQVQANAAKEFRDDMISRAISIECEIEKLRQDLVGLWGHEADLAAADVLPEQVTP